MEKIYFFCAVFGSIFIVVQFFLTLVSGWGFEDTGDMSSDFDSGSDAGGMEDVSNADGTDENNLTTNGSGISFLRVLSIRTVTAAVAFFGLTGMASLKGGLHRTAALAIACCSGLAAMILVFFLFRFISSFRYNGAVSANTLPGSEGTVYLHIPPGRSGVGKVIVNHQGRSMEYEAFTDSEKELSTGTPIIVKESLGPNQVLVCAKMTNKQQEKQC